MSGSYSEFVRRMGSFDLDLDYDTKGSEEQIGGKESKMENKHLKHYGVLGMKWGVRRYQTKDGSLTSAGKQRYGSENTQKESLKSKIVRKVNEEAARNANRYMDKARKHEAKTMARDKARQEKVKAFTNKYKEATRKHEAKSLARAVKKYDGKKQSTHVLKGIGGLVAVNVTTSAMYTMGKQETALVLNKLGTYAVVGTTVVNMVNQSSYNKINK